MTLTSGTKLGPCEIHPPFAAGMGELYRAKETRLDRTVAVKILRTHLLMMLLVCVSGAFSQTSSSFWVSTTGNDSNPGTQSAPWRSIQHAADSVRAGSTVNVRGGVYEELVTIKASGNATDGFITFRSYPGETAILDAEHFTPFGRQGVLTIHNHSAERSEMLCVENCRLAGVASKSNEPISRVAGRLDGYE
ncbi:MAG: DUF1565 domain-containing protein, partial [Candidatus Sulfotelmatobacter sp.]